MMKDIFNTHREMNESGSAFRKRIEELNKGIADKKTTEEKALALCTLVANHVGGIWKGAGYVEGGAGGLSLTKEFWDIINEIIFLGFVDLTD